MFNKIIKHKNSQSKKTSEYINGIIIAVFICIVSLSLIYQYQTSKSFAWDGPTQNPPQQNIPTPINANLNYQEILSGIVINADTENPDEVGLTVFGTSTFYRKFLGKEDVCLVIEGEGDEDGQETCINSASQELDGYNLSSGAVAISGSIRNILEPSKYSSVAISDDGNVMYIASTTGGIYSSFDGGKTWSSKRIRSTSVPVRDMAVSSDGTKIIAVAYGNGVFTSTNSGTSWTRRDGTTDRNWVSVASSADGTKAVAAVTGSKIFVSTNSGANWSSKESNRSWRQVAISDDGNTMYAVVSNGRVYVSTDSGSSWTPTDTADRDWQSIAVSSDGKTALAVAGSASSATCLAYVSTSTGSVWTQVGGSSIPCSNNLSMSKEGEIVVGAGQFNLGTVHASYDLGKTWIIISPGPTPSGYSDTFVSRNGNAIIGVPSRNNVYQGQPFMANSIAGSI